VTHSVTQEGRTLIDVLQVLAGSTLLLTLGASALLPNVATRSVDAAARRFADRLRGLAVRAVAEDRDVGLVFPEAGADEPFREAADEDGDGLSRSDLTSHRDSAGPACTLAADIPGVHIGPSPWPAISEPPTGTGLLEQSDPPVRFGRARMVVFDSAGHATPGSVLITDGARNLCSVVVAGATARVRIWCYERKSDTWQRR
jgi:hypothetical protein